MKKLLYLTTIIAVLFLSMVVVKAEEVYTIYLKGEYDYDTANEIYEILNEERRAVGKRPLTMDNDLVWYANLRAKETAMNFDHARLDGSYLWSFSKAFGENLIFGYESAEGAMRAWMNSPGHRRNILSDDYYSVGVGCYRNDYLFCTQIFGINYSSDGVTHFGTEYNGADETKIAEQYLDFGLYGSSNLVFQSEVPNDSLILRGKNYDDKDVLVVLNKKSATWTSENEEIATVDEYGVVTGHKNGTTVIHATIGNMDKSITIEVVGYEEKVIPEGTPLDVNGDGEADISDVKALLLRLSNSNDYAYDNDSLRLLLDINEDGFVDMSDVKALLIIINNSVK